MLNVIAPDLQTWVANKVHLRRMPRLKFMADTSFDNTPENVWADQSMPPAASADDAEEDGHAEEAVTCFCAAMMHHYATT